VGRFRQQRGDCVAQTVGEKATFQIDTRCLVRSLSKWQYGFLPRVMRDELVEPFNLCYRALAYPLGSRMTRLTNPQGTLLNYGATT